MEPALTSQLIAAAFIGACRDELSALKPGNVHVHAAGHGMETRQFEMSAEAAAPFIADANLRVGTRIRHAIEVSFAAAGCNTNLGIVLLCAPLAAAVGCVRAEQSEARNAPLSRTTVRYASLTHPTYCDTCLRRRLSRVLSALDRDDAAETFRAIAFARPAGLGEVAREDVSRPPTVTLKDAMALAADRDRIARAYVTDFEDIFAFGLPVLDQARAAGAAPDLAVTTLHMNFLAAFEDSHIARKHGAEAAGRVRRAADDRRRLWHPVVETGSVAALLAFDGQLKSEGLNPGTTADLVVATLFAERLARLRA